MSPVNINSKFTVAYFLFLICFINFIELNLSVDAAALGQVRRPTMIGEPLTPADYEKGSNLIISPDLAATDLSIDDGTFDDIIERKRNKHHGQDSVITPWPNAIVPYLLDGQFTENDRVFVAKAIQLIEANTCVRIISKTTENNYLLIKKDLVEICNSYIGMQGGKQDVRLAQRCIERFGSTSHELMHALGFLHEQSRADRDNFITVHYENIKEGSEYNFDKKEPPAANYAGAYDTQSLVHYSNRAFSKNGNNTIDSLAGSYKLGQREKLTQLDIDKINGFYQCSISKSNQVKTFTNTSNSTGPWKIRQESDSLNTNSTRTRESSTECYDFDMPNCRIWDYYGYCTKSPIFMSVYCKRTCKKCDIGCTDMNINCGQWAVKGYCDTYSHYMHHYCAYSCWIC